MGTGRVRGTSPAWAVPLADELAAELPLSLLATRATPGAGPVLRLEPKAPVDAEGPERVVAAEVLAVGAALVPDLEPGH